MQIAKNTLYSYLRKNKEKVEYLLELIVSEENLEKQFSNKETYLAIHKVVHKLNEPYKEVFLLRTFCELSFSQIGVLFEKSENWARVTYYRAKVMIKEELE